MNKFPKKQLTLNYLRNFLRKVESHNDKYLAEFTSLMYPTYVNNKKRGDKNAQAKENDKIIAAMVRKNELLQRVRQVPGSMAP